MSTTMKILVLTGSPHKQGTSNTLVHEFVRGAREAGHQITVYNRGMVLTKGAGTVGMMPEHYKTEAYPGSSILKK